jgi:hypothetical protein
VLCDLKGDRDLLPRSHGFITLTPTICFRLTWCSYSFVERDVVLLDSLFADS